MRSSHNLIKLALVSLLLLAVYFDYSNNQTVNATQQVQEEPVVVAKQVDKQQLQCLADNIYYEAGAEPTEGKAAVARVVLNRINHGFAPTPCKVVYQTNQVKQTNDEDETFWVKVCQFSWVCEGKGNPNRNSARYQSSLQVAKDVLIYDKYKEVIPKTVLFFHNTSYTNKFPHEVVAQIGNHIFYKKKHVKKHSKKSRERYVHSPRVSGETQSES
jgi:spore germination cell wall hydrolase CwlJ-like protein